MATAALTARESVIREMFAAVDRQDSRSFVTFLTDDGSFRFGNMPPAVGAEAIRSAFDGFCRAIKSLRHEFVEFFDAGETWTVEQMVHYVDGWDRAHVLPCVNILRFEGDKVADYRIFMDVSPLFIPPA